MGRRQFSSEGGSPPPLRPEKSLWNTGSGGRLQPPREPSLFGAGALAFLLLLNPQPLDGQLSILAGTSSHVAHQGNTIQAEAWVDLTTQRLGLGSIQGSLRFDAAQVALLSVASPGFSGTFEANQIPSEGVVHFAGINPSFGENTGRVTFLEVSFEIIGSPGGLSALVLAISELTTPDFQRMDGEVVIENGAVRIR